MYVSVCVYIYIYVYTYIYIYIYIVLYDGKLHLDVNCTYRITLHEMVQHCALLCYITLYYIIIYKVV